MTTTIITKKNLVAGILLIVLAGGWLYLSQLRQEFEDPNIFYILEDRLVDNNQLRITTRSFDYNATKALLQWRYDTEKMTLLKDNVVLVRSKWLVTGYSLKKTGSDDLFYEADNDANKVVVSRVKTFNHGEFIEETIIDSQATFEQFPANHTVSWTPIDNYKYRLTWRLDNVKFPESIKHGIFEGCRIETTNNVKINWCSESQKVDYAFVDLDKKRLSVYFNFVKGKQDLQIELVDPWWDSSWQYKVKLTLDTTLLSANVTNDHVVLVDINSLQSAFWAHANSDGNDVRFLDSAETTQLTFHFEDFNSVAQRAYAWVKVTDTFDSATDGSIYMYYGNSAAANAENRSGTYPSDYERIYHFGQRDSNTSVLDSTGNNNGSLSNFGFDNNDGWKTAQIFNGIQCDGVNDSISLNNLDDLGMVAASGTIMFWWKPDVGILSTHSDLNSLFDSSNPGTVMLLRDDIQGSMGMFRGTGVTPAYFTMKDVGVFTWSNVIWYQVVGRWNGTDMNLFFNGVDQNYATQGTFTMGANPLKFCSNGAGTSLYIDAKFDELKFFGSALSLNEIVLLYNSEARKLVYFGAEQGLFSPLVEDPGMLPIVIGKEEETTYDINISILDADTNANNQLIDINYSSSSTQGTGTVIANDLNLATGLVCDSNDLSSRRYCIYNNWDFSAVDDGNYFILVEVNDGSGTAFDASNYAFEILGAYIGTVDSNYASIGDLNFFPKQMVDYNVAASKQSDNNGFYRLFNMSINADTNVSLILLNIRKLFNFDSRWNDFRRHQQTDAMNAESDVNAFRKPYAVRLPINATDDFNVAYWTNNKFDLNIVDSTGINSGNPTKGKITFKILVTNVSGIEDINILIGNDLNNHVWQDINQSRDANLSSNVWFQWDMNLLHTKKQGSVNWYDFNFLSIRIKETVNATDFNVLLDEMIVFPTVQQFWNDNYGTKVCVDDDNSVANCYDLNAFAPIMVVSGVTTGTYKQFWIWGDFNLLNIPPDFIFDFDINFGIGVNPSA